MRTRWIFLLNWLAILSGPFLGAQTPRNDEFRPLPTDFFEHSIYQNADYRLILGGALFDPLVDESPVSPAWSSPTDQDIGFHLIQFLKPVRKQDIQLLKTRQLRVVRALRPFTLVVWGPGPQVQERTAWSNVRWTGPFQPGFKVLPSIRDLNGSYPVRIVTQRNFSESASFVQELLSLGGSEFRSRDLDQHFSIWTGTLPGAAFIAVAHLPQVYTLQLQHKPYDRGELSNQLVAGNIDVMNQAVTGYSNWLTQLGLDGTGIVMACVDSGVKEDHPDLLGQFQPCVGPGCGGSASSGHGTHVAGIMAGTGASGVVDPNDFLRALGVAPGSEMIEQRYQNLALTPGGVLALVRESFANNALLSNNSWGLSPIAQGYNVPAMELDLGIRDADPMAAGNQAFTYVIAVDNGNGGVSTIGSPDEAKNIFHVGAHQAQLTNTNQVAEYNNLANVTAHGPALDGRKLPLIVAPGCFVESAEPDTIYRLRCGTSMAAPHVAGGVALFIEYYRNLTNNRGGTPLDPSPALVKAAFLPVAVDLAGFLDADGNPLGHRFDSKQGWGRFSLPPIVQPEEPVLYYDDPKLLNNTGETWQRLVQAVDISKPAKLMLVWTDAPGHGLGGLTPALSNDLDLEVTYAGQTHLGNVFDASGWSAPGGTADALNNTEGVLLGPTASGMFEIKVQATNLSADGVPGTGSELDQDFALVCYNCEEVASFTLNATPDRLEVCAPENGEFNLDLTSLAGFSGAVTLTAPSLPMGLAAQFSQNPVTPNGSTLLTLSGTDALDRGAYEIPIVATSGGIQRQIILDLFVEPELPAAVSLQMPADLAVDQPLLPDFGWDSLANVLTYRFELDDDANFLSPVLALDLESNSLVPQDQLMSDTTYYWRVAGTNYCGQGSFSPTRSFSTRPIPPVLLVDDDNNSPDVRSAYTQALDALGVSYDIVDTQNSAQEPTDFSLYQAVIWFSGAATDAVSPLAGPTEATQNVLATYLDQGGSLLISSQSYLDDLSLVGGQFNPFMRDYLGVANGSRDAGMTEVTGTGAIFSDVGPETLSVSFGNSSDIINPAPEGASAFSSNEGSAAVTKVTPVFAACYLGFALDGMTPTGMEVTLRRWFEALGFEFPCSSQADFMEKLPDWIVDRNLAELLNCVNAIYK